MDGLPKCQANYVPLTPLTFLKRAAMFYADRTSIIHGSIRFTWQQTYLRCLRLASSFKSLNIFKNNVVSVLAPNIPATYELHFAVPMAGAVLNTINTRLDAKTISTILKHSEAKIFFVDYQYMSLARDALKLLVSDDLAEHGTSIPLVIVIDDLMSPTTNDVFGEHEYEKLIYQGNPRHVCDEIEDEWDPIALNYTSGTTSEPKGVVYSHRGAYLSALSLILGWEVGVEPVCLWTVPMFHCNGWTFTWGIAARGGTNVCIRNVTPQEIYTNISLHKVTHMCCAPVIFNLLLEFKPQERIIATAPPVHILTGGAAPPALLLEKIESLGFIVVHAYGLTEATGTALFCEWKPEWSKLPKYHQSQLKARQGVSTLTLAEVDVRDSKTTRSIPHDGKSMGEIVLRGSSIMKGYLKDQNATEKAFKGGWFATGDVGVIHEDGYIEIKDRSKDVIISGGENISSLEVETVLYNHPAVLEASVVAMPHPRWGESPCAFLALKKGSAMAGENIGETDIIKFCQKNMAGFMVPKKVVFLDELPKTSTGKTQKFQLRALAKTLLLVSKVENQKNIVYVQKNENMETHHQEHITTPSRM